MVPLRRLPANATREDQTIGSSVLFGPSVHIDTATHAISAVERRKWLESAQSITIGSE